MNIGEAARSSGVSAKMVRHYEEIGLIPAAQRTLAGYRVYSQNDVHTLRFIRQARNLGFSMVEIKKLLALWQDRKRPSRKVKELAEAHIRELDERITEMQDMKRTLETLVVNCHGDEHPECPILQGLETASPLPSARRRLVAGKRKTL
ncbi:MAG: Cu(I)-responsive transcriptional regulator [Gammaproteobacteria bacterium]|nr:Cu(I)-responsive transcriptional regulator [Gammaproteobacteria bacterium]